MRVRARAEGCLHTVPKNCIFDGMDTLLYFLLVVIVNLSLVFGIVSPLVTFLAACDMFRKGSREFPLVFHFAGFFGIFSFIFSLFSYFDGPGLPQWMNALAVVGYVLLWLAGLYMLITRK